MKIFERYVMKELAGPTLLGFGFYTFLIMMKSLFDFAEMIIKRSLPFSMVLKLLAFYLPTIIVLTIPMSLLFGILIAVGRLSADSEIIAMRSAGLSMSVIYRPVFYFSFIVFLLNLYLMNTLLPRGAASLENLKREMIASAAEKEVKPRVFYDEFPNVIVRVDDIDPASGQWKGVFVSDRSNPASPRVVLAESGRLSVVKSSKQVWLDLTGAENHVSFLARPDKYEISRSASQRFLMIDESGQGNEIAAQRPSFRTLTLPALRREAALAKGRDEIDYRVAMVEIHKKFSIPFACLAFGLVGLPLGITNRRGGKSSGFTLSIGLILVYYVMINNGEDLARNGKLPPIIAMWAPNLILSLFGMFLLRRANQSVGSHSGPSLWSRASDFVARIRGGRKKSRELSPAHSVEAPSLSPAFDIPFPGILDRYILKEFIKVLSLVLLSTGILFLIVDYTELVAEVTENKIPTSVVLTYYRYYVFQVLSWVLPISILLATLVTFGIFARNNEVTAIKAQGMSLYRVTLPIVIIACFTSVAAYYLHDFVLPYANRRSGQLRDEIRGKVASQTFGSQESRWTFGKNGRYIVNFSPKDKNGTILSPIQIFEFHPSQFKIVRRISAEEARFDGSNWVFRGGWIRSFGDEGSSSYTPLTQPLKLNYAERPAYFAAEMKAPNEMTFRELKRYIADLRRAGYSTDDYTVDLYEKTSWPFVSLVMVLIALPFSFKLGKKGALYGVGIALFVAFAYWTLFGIFSKLGDVGTLPGVLAAWSANILFALTAVYLFLHVET